MCLRLCAFASSCQGVGTSLSTAHVAPWQPTGMCTVADAVSKDFLNRLLLTVCVSGVCNVMSLFPYFCVIFRFIRLFLVAFEYFHGVALILLMSPPMLSFCATLSLYFL